MSTHAVERERFLVAMEAEGMDRAKAGCCPNGEGVQDRVHQHARFLPVFQGDPRGACVKLKVPSGRTDDGNHEGVCVPTRRY